MNNCTAKKLILLLLIGLTTTLITSAQVTIGDTSAPNIGALLELKNGADISTKGLGLPRVELITNTSLKPCLSEDESNNATQREKHVGLIVYNVGTEIETTKEDRLCKGLHVWDGNKWTPVVPYFDPDITRSGPKEKLTIVRGPAGVEVTEYTTAYFHGYSRVTSSGTPTTGSVYVCDRSKLIEIDAGQWMTMNLRTEYLPGSTDKLQRWGGSDTHRVAQCEELLYPDEITKPELYPMPLTAKEKELNGLLYNWVAATAVRDYYLALDSEWNKEQPMVQGICPAGWHLPQIKEWTEILYLFRAQHYLFGTGSTSTTWGTNTMSPFSGGKSLPPEQGGPDFRMLGTRHRNPKAGDDYMDNAFYWSSTAGPTDRPASSNGDIWKWGGRGYNAVFDLTTNGAPTASSIFGSGSRSRPINESVRCKKN